LSFDYYFTKISLISIEISNFTSHKQNSKYRQFGHLQNKINSQITSKKQGLTYKISRNQGLNNIIWIHSKKEIDTKRTEIKY